MKINKPFFLSAFVMALKASLFCALLFQPASLCRAFSPYGQAADKYPSGAAAEPGNTGGKSGLVFLKWRTVDPRAENGMELKEDYQGTRIFIVNFTRTTSLKKVRSVEDKELSFLEKVPDNSFLVRATSKGLARLKSLEGFRSVLKYKPQDKIDPALLSERWKEPVVIEALLARGESPASLADETRSELFLGLIGDEEKGIRLRWLVKDESLAEFSRRLAAREEVILVTPFFLPRVLNDDSIWVIQSYDTVDKRNYALSATLFNHGLLGQGEIAGVSDSGLDNDMCYFSYGENGYAEASYPSLPATGPLDMTKKVIGYTVLPGASAYDNNATCSVPVQFHGTHTSGSVVGDNFMNLASEGSIGHDTGDGMAPMAKLYFQDAGDDTSGCLTGLANDYEEIFRQAYDAGVRIHSNSWGSSSGGQYTTEASEVDRFLYDNEDFSLFFAAGNSGPFTGTVDSPASAKNCVAVGSVVSGEMGADAVSDFSSRGPASDGRIKPDIMAPGESIVSASGTISSSDRNCGFKWMSGTSMSTPTAAGGAVLLRNYFAKGFYPGGAADQADSFSPSSSLIKAALVAGAMDVGGVDIPNVMEGWGRVNLDRFAFFRNGDRDSLRPAVYDVRNEAGLTDGEEMAFDVAMDAVGPLKIVLVWLDPEGTPMSSRALVNDLDLEAVSPSGETYRGNNFVQGISVSGGQSDNKNNVEGFYLPEAAAGRWQVKVKASDVNGTPRQDDSERQGFALVIIKTFSPSPEAAPSGLEAVDEGETGISLSWNAVGGADSYSVYRTTGTAPDSPVTFVGGSATTTFTDMSAQGGYLYTYFVRAAAGNFEGPASEKVTVTGSGDCSLRPRFAGVVSAVNDDDTPGCDIVLGWGAAEPRCPLYPGIGYNVYRDDSPDFVPSQGNKIASGVGALSFRDSTIPSSNTYYYVVRAEDQTGNEDSNIARINATPFGEPVATGDWTDDGGDTLALMSVESPWNVNDARNHTPYGKYSYSIADKGLPYRSNSCASLKTPLLEIRSDAPELSYSVSYNLENGWDGVVTEISENGSDFVPITPSEGYPGSFAFTGTPPVNRCGIASTQGAFSGPKVNDGLTAWALYTHDLSAYKGRSVTIRWRFSSDPASEYDGFFIDDIRITGVFLPSHCEGTLPSVSFNRASYGCSDDVSVRVYDGKRKGTGEQTVMVSSDSEGSPEAVAVLEDPAASGYFYGSIMTESAAPSHNGNLSVSDGDNINASYAGTGGDAEAEALADCKAPTLTSSSVVWLSATSVRLNFTADEDVTAVVRYGVGDALDMMIEDELVSSSHKVEISGLQACSGYSYRITVTDVAGNSLVGKTGTFETKGCFPAPQITGVRKMSDPFRLVVTGTGFAADAVVKINNIPVPDTKYRSSTRLVAKKGALLKAMVPMGETVSVTVQNVDDVTQSEPYYFTR